MSERRVVIYTKDQREWAKKLGQHLVCVDAMGVTFTGPVTKEQATALLNYLTENILKVRKKHPAEPA